MRFQKRDGKGGRKSAQTTADRWSMSINFNFNKFPVQMFEKKKYRWFKANSTAILNTRSPVFENWWIGSELVQVVKNFVAGHLNIVNCNLIPINSIKWLSMNQANKERMIFHVVHFELNQMKLKLMEIRREVERRIIVLWNRIEAVEIT